MKFHFSTGFAGSTKYCWFPENKDFDVGKKVKADKVDCCSVAVITQKTDNSLWMTSPASSTSYCIAVEGMPYKHLHAFDGKGLKLSTGKYGFLSPFNSFQYHLAIRDESRHKTKSPLFRACFPVLLNLMNAFRSTRLKTLL